MLKFSDNNSVVTLRRVMFAIMAFFCYFYVLYTSDFAELHVKFSQLHFPIFIGEILLFVCIIWMIFNYRKTSLRFSPVVLFCIIAYLLWICIKAYAGYQVGGPLALRNAALFYYPLFALVGYMVFVREVFNATWQWILLVFLFLNLFFVPLNDYFVMAFMLLALGFSLHLRQPRLRLAGVVLCIFFIIYSKILWWNGRSHMVGIAVMAIFLGGYFLFGMLKARKRIKWWTMAILVGLFVIFLFKFGDRNSLKSMLTFQDLRRQYNELDAHIQMRKKYYVQEHLPPQVYHENPGRQMFGNLVNTTPAVQSLPKGTTVSTLEESKAIVDSIDSYLKETSVERKQSKKDLQEDIQKVLEKKELNIPKEMRESMEKVATTLKTEVKNSDTEIQKKMDVDLSRTMETLKKQITEEEKPAEKPPLPPGCDRELDIAYGNIYFRIFVWRDMIEDFKNQKAWGGVSWGQAQRSPSLEILDWATKEWERDGWIAPHNSFLHMIYRGGIIGLFCVMAIFALLVSMTKRFLRMRSVWGGLLMASLVYWVTITNFLVFLELPYSAIPFWTFFGITLAYLHSLEKENSHDAKN